ncbi:F-box/LRR-repeat protein At5g02910 [Linum grandiflorum]
MTKNKKSNSSSNLGVDRLTNLPDSILHHILSFLDTNDAIHTCILSNQWKCTWKHVHALNLNLDMLDEYAKHERFVDKFLSLRCPLRVSKVSFDSNIYGWIDDAPDDGQFGLLRRVLQYAVSHGAQHFDLKPRFDLQPNTPFFELFNPICDSVISLDLSWFDIYCQPQCSSRFRLLTTLKLRHCNLIVKDGELVEPFSQFPCLKDLVLHYCLFFSEGSDHRSARLRVSGIELVKLTILVGADVDVPKLEIFAPKLKSFILLTDGRLEFSEITLPSLVHADIRRQLDYSVDEDDDIVEQHLAFIFHGLRNVESLTLCNNFSEAVLRISKFLEQQPCPFKRLKKLNLEFVSKDGIPYEVLDRYFLNGSSNDGLNIQIPKKESWHEMIKRMP